MATQDVGNTTKVVFCILPALHLMELTGTDATLMNSHQITWIRHTFAKVADAPDVAALAFYRNLFTLDPSLRPLFGTDILVQSKRLMEGLGIIVNGLDQPERLTPMLEELGARHVGYGVCDAHYATAGRALLLMFSQTLGSGFSEEAMSAWESAWEWTARTMMRGARSASAEKSPAIRQTKLVTVR